MKWLGYGPNQNRVGGAQSDSRLIFDTTRFVIEVEGELSFGLKFEAEVELEHHGAGAALELEFEEFGEFEQEVEAGGEVLLEKLYLQQTLGDVRLKIGRFYVGVGLMSALAKPTRYLGTGRPESESVMLPGVWDEIGVALEASLGPVEATDRKSVV